MLKYVQSRRSKGDYDIELRDRMKVNLWMRTHLFDLQGSGNVESVINRLLGNHKVLLIRHKYQRVSGQQFKRVSSKSVTGQFIERRV